MKEYRVLVFPCGTEIANEVINSLRNHKYFKVLLASSDENSFCNFRKSKVYTLPFISDQGFIYSLNKLVDNNSIDFIIPVHDDVAYELSIKSKDINAKIIGQNEKVNKIVRFKDKTYEFFSDKLPIAKIFKDIPRKNDYPIFVKPIRGQGSQNALLIQSPYEFNSFFKKFNRKDFIVMEYLSGQEFTIDCFSHEGELLYFGARTRDKMTRGIAVLSSFVTDDSLNHQFSYFAKTISKEMQMHGIWFFQMKFDKKNQLKLLEIGPRVPGSMMLNRARGINFTELALYQTLGEQVSIAYNNIEVSLARALQPRYKHNLNYNSLYIDFDDTLYLHEKKINSELIKLIFDAKNNNKKVFLITKNKKNNLTKVLHQYGITNIFDDIIHIDEKDLKTNYMMDYSLLVDDSFIERKMAIERGHYAIGLDLIDIIY